MQRLRLAGFGLILAIASSARADDAQVVAIVGDIELPSKITAHYEYHFDQNALSDFRMSGENIVALTDSGMLVRFDSKTRKPKQTRFDPDRVVCLGTDRDNGVLCGFEKGRICRVDPATLGLTEVVKLEGKPQWLEMRPGGLLAVVERMVDVNYEGKIYQQKLSFIHDASTGKLIPVGYSASAFLLDRKGRLWLGDDRGEWGGHVSRADLKSGAVNVIAPPKDLDRNSWRGIYGFVELQSGQVWAFGGTMHMGVANSSICRVDLENAVELANFSTWEQVKAAREGRKLARPVYPRFPITHIIEEPDGRLLVLSYDSIYRTDPKLAKWERLVDLKLSYRPGRPDAVGVYPAIKRVQRLPGVAPDLLFATTLNGFVRFADGKLSDESLPGRLGASHIDHIQSSAEGLLFWDEETEATPWRFAKGAWEQMSFVPPLVLHPDELKEQERAKEEFEEQERQKKAVIRALVGEDPDDEIFDEVPSQWITTKVLIDTDGKIFSVSVSSGGTLTTVRWQKGKPEVLGSEMSSIDPAECFITPDGVLGNMAANAVYEFTNGLWVIRTKLPDLEPATLSTAECKDGLGRLWTIADGLWMSVPGEKVSHSFKTLPMIGRSTVTAIAADPDHPDGIAAALDDGGVVFVRVPKGP